MNHSTDAIFTVSQLNLRARQLLEISFASVRVEGEISNLSRPASGHWYFTLKDSGAQVRCAMFKSRTALLKFSPKDGDKVELRAKVSLYENRGDYQLIVDSMRPAGEGALLLAFQQLKDRLQLEGLFSNEYKKSLPPHIKRVAIVTSPTGAAIHDMLTVLARRDPSIQVDIYPTAVQGKEATAQIVAAIERVNRDNLADVIIVGRGGGSLEDLWCFNEEPVARALFASRLPIISAVGHEVDVSIADFVADLRAPTPSAAAELISVDSSTRLQHLEQLSLRLSSALERTLPRLNQRLQLAQQRLRKPARLLQQRSQQLDLAEMRLRNALHLQMQNQQTRVQRLNHSLQQQHPQRQLALQQKTVAQLHLQLIRAQQAHLRNATSRLQPLLGHMIQAQKQQQWRSMQQLQHLPNRLDNAQKHNLQHAKQSLQNAAALLDSFSPLKVLTRGYSITETATNTVIHSTQQVSHGDRIRTRLRDGWLESDVIEVRNGELSE